MRKLSYSVISLLLISASLLGFSQPAQAAISTNGLVLHLDAGNSGSYPGSGTTWTDISGSGINGTLTNGPTYSANNGGFIGFDAVNDYVNFGSISTNFSSGFSASFYANMGASTQSWERIFDFGNGQSNDNILIGRSGNTDNLAFEIYSSSTSLGQCISAGLISNNTWAHYTLTVDGTNCRWYRNGNLVSSTSYTGLPRNVTRTSNFLGRSNWSGDGYFESGISEISLYNRAINAGEVWQNFKAQSDFCSTSITSASTTRYVQITSGNGCLWVVPAGITSIDYFLVGGGGGGGGANNGSLGAGGGGGGGATSTSTNFAVTSNSSLSLRVGGGGAGGSVNAAGGNGGTTSLFNFTSTFTVSGGIGGQGAPGTNAQADLSGDGGNSGSGKTGGASDWDGGGGGAGDGTNGSNGIDIGGQGGSGGAGGAGVTTSVTPSATFFAAGGGGGGTPSNNVAAASQTDGFGGLGGSSVGGNGGVISSTKGVATAGAANTGSGGGGGGWNFNYSSTQKMGGAGANGVIWIKFTRGTSSISSIAITSSAGSDSQYTFGETITVTVIFSDTVTITGTPRIPVQGLSSKYFNYASGSDSSAILFSYVVGSSDLDTDGIAISLNSLELNGGSVIDLAGLAVTITHAAINASSSYYVDGRLIGSVTAISYSTAPSFRSPVTITVTVSIVGNVQFRANGVKISNCVKRAATGTSPNITATCVWKPSIRGNTRVMATLTPTNGSYSSGSLTNSVFVTNRSSGRS